MFTSLEHVFGNFGKSSLKQFTNTKENTLFHRSIRLYYKMTILIITYWLLQVNVKSCPVYKNKIGVTQKCCELFRTNLGRINTQQNSCYVDTYLPSQKPSKQDMLGSAGEITMNSLATFSFGLLHIDAPILASQ